MSSRGKTKPRSNSEKVGRIHEIMNFSKRYKEGEEKNGDLKSDIEAHSTQITSSRNPMLGKSGFGTEWRQQVQQLTRVFRPSEAETKSPLSYIKMIAQAINSTFEKKLVLADIYTYMEHRFFQYLAKKPRWKNTVRHNLSHHKCFVKCEYSRRKGNRSHYWAIHPNFVAQFNSGNFRKTLNAIPYAIRSPRAWSGQHLARLNPTNFQASFPCLSFDFPYETLGNLYERSAWPNQQFASCVNPANLPPAPFDITSSLDFPYEPLTKLNNPVPFITQPFTEARGQILTQRGALQLYPEALPTPYQYHCYVNPTPSWQIEHVHMPISNTAIQAFHEIHPGSFYSPITSVTPRNVSYTNTTKMIQPKSSASTKTLHCECPSEK